MTGLAIDVLNQICLNAGAAGGHTQQIDALNAWAVALGKPGGYTRLIDAYNAIAGTSFQFDIQALNDICGDQGQATTSVLDVTALGLLITPGVPGIALSAATVAENAPLGVVVGALSSANPGETFTLTNDAGGKFAVAASNLIVSGVFDYATATSHPITVHGTAAGDQPFTIAITDVVEAPPDNPPPTDGEVTDDGTFANPPVVTETNGNVKVSGKGSGSGKFLYAMGAPLTERVYTMQYDPDFTLLGNTGKNAFVGFGMKGAAGVYHLIGLQGDGSTGLNVVRLNGSNLANPAAPTATALGAADNGTQAGPNWLQLETSADGTSYTLRSSANGTTWTEEATGTMLAGATDFGVAGYFAAGDTGHFAVAISVWTDALSGDPTLTLDLDFTAMAA